FVWQIGQGFGEFEIVHGGDRFAANLSWCCISESCRFDRIVEGEVEIQSGTALGISTWGKRAVAEGHCVERTAGHTCRCGQLDGWAATGLVEGVGWVKFLAKVAGMLPVRALTLREVVRRRGHHLKSFGVGTRGVDF